MTELWLNKVKFDAQGLVPVVVQDADTRQVLMMAYMNKAALLKTAKTRKVHFYSRSRKKLWMKGETSGHIQQVREISLDCDGDAILILARQTGGACHEGYKSCFFRGLDKSRHRWKVSGKRIFDPQKVYGSSLQARLPRPPSAASQ